MCRPVPWRTRTMLAALIVAATQFGCAADAPAEHQPENSPAGKPAASHPPRNLTMKTLGGRQFWGDVLFFHGWKIQKNVVTGHYRLLDGDDYRHASGSLEKCKAKLDEIRKKHKLPPMKGKAVIVIHGIVRSSKSFGKMRKRLEKDGATVFGFDYPSTRVGITQSAGHLEKVLTSLEGIEQIDLVVHSMGGLIVRAYLAKAGDKRDKRIRRMVMLGVPNHGARLADKLKKNPLFKFVMGPAGAQMASDKDGFIRKLPIPDFEFAVIAGARGTINGYNPLVPGDDDGTVSINSTRLPGAADFLTVKCLHSFLMNHDEVIDATARFLDRGRLRDKGEPRPIPRAEPAPARATPPAGLKTSTAGDK